MLSQEEAGAGESEPDGEVEEDEEEVETSVRDSGNPRGQRGLPAAGASRGARQWRGPADGGADGPGEEE